MSIHKVIEVSAISEKSWEDAAQMAVHDAAQTIKNIRSVYVKEFLAEVDHDRIVGYRAIVKVSFEVQK